MYILFCNLAYIFKHFSITIVLNNNSKIMETTTMAKIDAKKVEAFLGRVVTDLGAALSITLSYMGDKMGLYKAMAYAGPLSAAELANKTNTHETYVREWLINQAAGGYIEFDPSGKYFLPDEHALALTNGKSVLCSRGIPGNQCHERARTGSWKISAVAKA